MSLSHITLETNGIQTWFLSVKKYNYKIQSLVSYSDNKPVTSNMTHYSEYRYVIIKAKQYLQYNLKTNYSSKYGKYTKLE